MMTHVIHAIITKFIVFPIKENDKHNRNDFFMLCSKSSDFKFCFQNSTQVLSYYSRFGCPYTHISFIEVDFD